MEKESYKGRNFVGIYFSCCHVYTRVYKHKQGDKYVGFCPKCGAKVQLKVGPEGTSDRFFIAK